MTIPRRAFVSTINQKGKNLLLLMLVLCLGVLIYGSFLLMDTFNNTTANLRNSLPPVVAIGDMTIDGAHIDIATANEVFSRELIHEIGELPQVSHYDYSLTYSISGDFELYRPEGFEYSGSINNGFRLFGVSRPEIIYFENGMYELVLGRTFTQDEINFAANPSGVIPILASSEFAQLNNVSLGDTIELFGNVFALPEDAQLSETGLSYLTSVQELWEHPYNNWVRETSQFEIIGIFNFTRELSESPSGMEIGDHYSMYNLFFAPNWFVHETRRRSVESSDDWIETLNIGHLFPAYEPEVFFEMGQLIFVLDDILSLDSFTTSVNELVDGIDVEVLDLSGIYGTMQLSVINLNNLMNLVFIVSICAMAVVLSLLMLLYVRDRRNEFGIYLALGEKRLKIVLQIILEVTMVSILGIAGAIIIANILSQNITMHLLTNQLIENARSDYYWPAFLELIGFAREMSVEEMLDAVNVSLDMTTILMGAAIIFGTIIVSTAVPATYLLELKPTDLLEKGKVG